MAYSYVESIEYIYEFLMKLSQIIDTDIVKHTQVAITSPNTTTANTGGGGCGSGSGSQELVSLSGEYNNQLSSIVINNVNHIPISNSSFLLFFNKIFNIDFYSYFFEPFDLLDGFINLICQSCTSDPKCQCTCSCKPPCTGNTICLCLCTDAKPGDKCCICICKKEENTCKCICICICNKPGDTCCGKEHACKQSLVKVDIQSLSSNTSEILNCLCLINCYISKLENQNSTSSSNTRCCGCICSAGRCCKPIRCSSYCCCKEGKTNYLVIISTIQWIEFLFKEVGPKIGQLRTLKNILSLISAIATNCKSCPVDCCKNINSLIENIENAMRYYYLFDFRIKDIRSFVEYKVFYHKSKQILFSIEKSINPLIKELELINNQLLTNFTTNNASLVQINNLLMSVYSQHSMTSSIFLLMRVMKWAEFINYFFNTNEIIDSCSCLNSFETKNNISEYYMKGYSDYTHKIDSSILSKLNKQTYENHICLCLVFKYVLYPTIMRSLYFVFGRNLEIHGTYDRKFDNYNYSIDFNNNESKMLLFVFHIISVIMNIISKDSYVKWTSGGGIRVDVKCFCMTDKHSRNYLISITLFVSSLMENIWTMEKQMFQVFVNHLSSFMWEFDMVNNKNKKVELNETLITLTKSTSYFSSLAVTDRGLGLIIRGSNEIIYSLNNILEIDESIEKTYRYSISCNIKLFYQNFTFFSFYIFKNSKITGNEKKIKKLNMRMSRRYLSITFKARNGCVQNDRSEGCKKFIYKIVYFIICLARGKFNIMSSQITSTSIIKFIQQNQELNLYEIIINMNRKTIDGTEMILRMLKNNLINPNTYSKDVIGNMGVKDSSTTSWGYEKEYEHEIATSNSYSDNYALN